METRTVTVRQYLIVETTTTVEVPDYLTSENDLRNHVGSLPVRVSVESMLDNDNPVNKVKVLGITVDEVSELYEPTITDSLLAR